MKSEKVFDREWVEWIHVWWDDAGDNEKARIACVGDSMAYGYTPVVRDMIHDKGIAVDMYTSSHCAGDPSLLAQLEFFFGPANGYKYDVIHFNNCLHGDCNNTKIPFDIYRGGLVEAIETIHRLQPEAKLIIATGTHMSYGCDNQYDYDPERNAAVMKRNDFIREYAKENGYVLNDLFPIVAGKPEYPHVDGIHFGPEGVQVLADAVVEKVLTELDMK